MAKIALFGRKCSRCHVVMYVYIETSPPPPTTEISTDVTWGEKFEKMNKKEEKM
jgi:hypothetical protein